MTGSINCSACLHCCNGRGSCLNGSCFCQVQFSGQTCEDPNLSYLVSFGCIFFLLFVIATVQLVLCMLFDSRKSNRPCLKRAFRVTTQKLLYGIVIAAAGTRGIYFSVQEYIPSQWGDILLNLYYPALITGFSLLMCHWAESFQHSNLMNVSQHQYLNKYSATFLIFNIFVYSLWIAEVISTALVKSSLQVRKTNIFNIIFAFLMLLTLLGFVCIGVKLFLQHHNKKLIVNSKQQKHSLVGLVSQTLLQGLVVILLLYDMFSHLYHSDVTDNVSIGITIRVLEFGVALWFSCALWNIKKPDTLWVLSPEIVVRISNPQERKQNNYGTISARPEDRCFICLDEDLEEDLMFPCNCRGELGVVHPSCLQKLCVTLLTSSNRAEHPSCKVCNQKYKIESPSFWVILSVPSVRRRLWIQGIILCVIIALSFVTIYFASVYIQPTAARFFVVCIVIVTDLIIFQFAGYHWWLYYKKIKSASIRIDGPRAVVMERASGSTSSSEIEEQSEESNQDNAPNVLDSNSDRELTETTSPSGNLSSEDNIFCLDDDSNCADESSLLLSQSQTTQQHNYNAINPASMTISVIVHSPSSDIT